MFLTTTACALLLACTLPAEWVGDPSVLRQASAVAVVSSDDSSSQQTPNQPAAEKAPPTPPHTGVRALTRGLVDDVKQLPSKPNAYLATLGGGLALAVHPIDDDVNSRLRGSEDFWLPGKWVGHTAVQMGAAAVVFAVGRVGHEDKVSHLGMDLLRAQIITSGLTVGLKYATNRERPDHSNSHSFPSGHASITFATATVIERHLGWRYSALGYTIASYVAASRLHDNRHWLSDVVFGAAVGAIGGRTVTQHGRNVWTMTPVPVPGGIALVALRTGG